jgi:hypothetical protein
MTRCLARGRFRKAWQAFILRNTYSSPQQPGEPGWVRVESLAAAIRQARQYYWVPRARLAIDECIDLYFENTWYTIKGTHKPMKQGHKILALGNLGYIYNWP